MTPTELAERYFRSIRARDVEALMALYAEDAVLILPNGKQLAGAAEIRALQDTIFNGNPPYPTPGPTVTGTQEIAVEIRAELPDGQVRHTANFFHLNAAGRIQRLSVYAQGG